MNDKIVAVDLDGTLLRNDNTISDVNKATIKEMVDKGNYLVINSGRPYFRVDCYADELGIRDENNYVICYNGALVCTADKSKIIYKKHLNDDDVSFIIDNVMDNDLIDVLVYHEDCINCHHFSKSNYPLSLLSCMKWDKEGKKSLRNYKNVFKLLYIGEEKDVRSAYNKLPKEFFDRFNVCFSGPRWLEFMPKGVDKGEGIYRLAEYLNVDRKDTIAIGDQENDKEMISKAGIGCVMANGIDSVKKIADYICPSNEEDGVSDVIRKYVLNEDLD